MVVMARRWAQKGGRELVVRVCKKTGAPEDAEARKLNMGGRMTPMLLASHALSMGSASR